MTKRSGNFESLASKKPKVDGNDDDWDDSDLDNCLVLATQICEESINKNTNLKLPTYNEFEQPSKCIYTSTQNIANTFPPSNNISKNRHVISKECNIQIEQKIKLLQEKCEAKEGEVTILRNQLKTIRTNLEVEFNKKQEEWSQKVSLSTREINAMKSDLEFKDLEIANLKQKITEITRISRLDSSFSCSQMQSNLKTKINENNSETSKRQKLGENSKSFTISPITFPSFLCDRARYFKNFGKLEREIYYLNNGSVNLFLISHSCDNNGKGFINFQTRICIEKELSNMHEEIYKLLNSSQEDLNSVENASVITKIIAISYFFIESLSNFLEDLCKKIQTKNIRQIDSLYLENKLDDKCDNQSLLLSGPLCDDEIGISARQSIALIATILPFNSFLQSHLIENKDLLLDDLEDLLKSNCEKCLKKKNYFLVKLLYILKIIGKTRKGYIFPGLLLATIDLLHSICLTSNFNKVSEFIVNITQEIIFTRPNFFILKRLTNFMEVATTNISFVNRLCKKPNENSLDQAQREGFLYFNSKACILQIYCILMEEGIKKSENVDILLYSNIVNIMSNILKSNSNWTFYRENEHNNCLCKISKLFIDITYSVLQEMKTEPFISCDKSEHYLEHKNIIKAGLRVIHMLNFQSVLDLIVKYLSSHSQYKSITNLLFRLKDSLTLSKSEVELVEAANVSEDELDISTEKFKSIVLLESI